ncbi:MAG: GNAT family N-acetyltransferase [Pseudomonadota bacterium]
MNVRPTKPSDTEALQRIVAANQMFPPEILPDLIAGFFEGPGNSNDLWLCCEIDGAVAGFCYAVPQELAEGTWNMRAIAVDPSQQRGGVGTALVKALATKLSRRGGRVLIADTSSTADFAQARRFYLKTGYTEEARLRDFWAAGDDKVVFWKAL